MRVPSCVDEQSYMFGETFGNNQSRLGSGGEGGDSGIEEGQQPSQTLIIHDENTSPDTSRFNGGLSQFTPKNLINIDDRQDQSNSEYSKSSQFSESEEAASKRDSKFSEESSYLLPQKKQKRQFNASDLSQNSAFMDYG